MELHGGLGGGGGLEMRLGGGGLGMRLGGGGLGMRLGGGLGMRLGGGGLGMRLYCDFLETFCNFCLTSQAVS